MINDAAVAAASAVAMAAAKTLFTSGVRWADLAMKNCLAIILRRTVEILDCECAIDAMTEHSDEY